MISSEDNSDSRMDLRGTPCPVNYIRCRLALESLGVDEALQVDLDRGEPEDMVISGLRELGHTVVILFEENGWIRIQVKIGDC